MLKNLLTSSSTTLFSANLLFPHQMPAISADQRAVWTTYKWELIRSDWCGPRWDRQEEAWKKCATWPGTFGVNHLDEGGDGSIGGRHDCLWNTIWSSNHDRIRFGVTVTMIHMTDRPNFNSVKTKVEKSGGNVSDLSSALDQVAVLGQLRGHGHVHKFVCNAHLIQV